MWARSRRSMASANKAVGVLIRGEQGSRARHRAQAPVGSAGARSFFEPLQRRAGSFPVTDVGRGFDEFEEAPTVEAQILVLTAFTRGREGLLVSTETVEKDCGGVSGQSDQTAFTPWRFRPPRPPRSASRRPWRTPRHAARFSEWYFTRRVACRCGDRVGLLDKPCCRCEFASIDVDACPVGERWRNHRKCAGVTGAPNHVGGDLLARPRRPTVHARRIPARSGTASTIGSRPSPRSARCRSRAPARSVDGRTRRLDRR